MEREAPPGALSSKLSGRGTQGNVREARVADLAGAQVEASWAGVG